MNDPSGVQGINHPEELDGEEDGHRLDTELVALTLFDDIDDIEEGAELLVVTHKHPPVLEDVVPWYRHEGRGQMLRDSLLNLSADVKLPIIGWLLNFQDSINTWVIKIQIIN